ncbi:MAG: hypothetical protein EPO21_20490 [Chloroflexota bacterium]|nr:MAG: hypothetical protein EPO21_20490 [Chloroflexota bacterium]
MSLEQSSTKSKRLDSWRQDQIPSLDTWVSDLRHACLDNLSRTETEGPRATLKARLFPLSSGYTPDLRDVLYAESAWAAGTLVVCFLAYVFSTGSLMGALAFTLVADLLMLPVLVVWAGVGCYLGHKRKRDILG